MNRACIIIVHDLEQATAALEAARACNRAVILRSAPDAAAYLGAAVFRAMIEEAAAAVPGATFTAEFDCGDKPGQVMNALRRGIAVVRADLDEGLRAKMTDIAAASGARVIPYDDAPTLDLRAAPDPAAACRDWLKKS